MIPGGKYRINMRFSFMVDTAAAAVADDDDDDDGDGK